MMVSPFSSLCGLIGVLVGFEATGLFVSNWSRTYDRGCEQHVPLLNKTVYVGVTFFSLCFLSAC